MPPSATVTTYRTPPGSTNSLVVWAVFAYLLLGSPSTPSSSIPGQVQAALPGEVFAPARYALGVLGEDKVKLVGGLVLGAGHVVESLYTGAICVGNGVPAGTTVRVTYVLSECSMTDDACFVQVKYMLATLVYGFPTWVDLKKRLAKVKSA